MVQEGAQGDSIAGYKLPVVDTQVSRRNFPGYTETQPYSLEEMKTGQSNVISTETKGGTKKN